MTCRIVRRCMTVPNIHELTVAAPEVAESIAPGQFVIVRPGDRGERVPLSVADFDREAGTVTCFFMEVGESTSKLALLKAGDTLPTFAGPLGTPTEIDRFGDVLCVGGCFGIGSILPVVRALVEAGNRVYVLLEARSSYLLYWVDRHRELAERVVVITRDGTQGHRGHVGALPRLLGTEGIPAQNQAQDRALDRVIVNGCTFLSRRMAEATRPMGVKTIVSMNPIMIDGTGMCGVCRLTVGGATRFACVDGPDFDAHEIDWTEFLQRRRTYFEEEIDPLRKTGVGTAHHLGRGHPGGCGSGHG